MKITHPAWLGFVAGVVLGMGDFFLLRALSVTMIIGGRDATFWVVLLFAINFGALGAVIARLWEQRRGLRRQAALIRSQYQELQAVQGSLVEQETLAAVGRMSAGVAHEVRNPLSVIRSSAQMLAADADGEGAQAARFICEEVDRLDDFVRRVLDFSRRVQVHAKPTPWSELRERLAAAIGADAELDEAGGVYQLDTELTVRLLANLVDNARKAGDGVRVRIEAGEAAIEVVDDGPGIAPEHRESVFEAFFTTRPQGTGLGLTMARKLARVQGWDLELGDGGLGPAARGARFRLVPRPVGGRAVAV